MADPSPSHHPSRRNQGYAESPTPRRGDAAQGGGGENVVQSIRLQTLHRPQERLRERQTGSRPECTKQVYSHAHLPAHHSGSGQATSQERLVAGSAGPAGRLLARTNTSQVQEVPVLQDGLGLVPVHETPLRSVYRSSSLHQTNESGGFVSRQPRSGCPHVPGRLATDGTLRRRGHGSSEHHPSHNCQDGLPNQQKEVPPHPNKIVSLAGNAVAHAHSFPAALLGQHREDKEASVRRRSLRHLLPQAVGGAARLSQLRGRSTSPREALSPDPDQTGQQSLPYNPQGPPAPHASPPAPLTQTLADRGRPSTMGAVDRTSLHSVSHHRRVQRRLGLSIRPGPSGLGQVGSTSGQGTHKHQGTLRCLEVLGGQQGSRGRVDKVRDGQHCRSSLHQQTRLLQVKSATQMVDQDLGGGLRQKSPSDSSTRPRTTERLGRRTLPVPRNLGRVDSPSDSVLLTDGQMGHPTSRPVRLTLHQQATKLPDQGCADRSRRSRRVRGGLEQVAIHLPVSPTLDQDPTQSVPHTQDLQGQSTPHRPPLDSATLVHGVTQVVPPSTPPRELLPHRPAHSEAREILTLTRLDLLRTVLKDKYSPRVVNDIVAGHRPSTTRQYQSCWAAFQRYMRTEGESVPSQKLALSFLSFLSHEKKRTAPTITVHLAALADPLEYGFGITLDQRLVTLLKKGLFHQNPKPRPNPPSWDIRKVLMNLTKRRYTEDPDQESILVKALFLVSLASGYRSSQLRALTRFPTWTTFLQNNTSVRLAPSPTNLAKNEREDFRLQPITIPAWKTAQGHHALCPVAALRNHLATTPEAAQDALFVNPGTLISLKTSAISLKIKRLIMESDPGAEPRTHDVRGYAASMLFTRTRSLEEVTRGGQWATPNTFIRRYLSFTIQDTPCVAMGNAPAQ